MTDMATCVWVLIIPGMTMSPVASISLSAVPLYAGPTDTILSPSMTTSPRMTLLEASCVTIQALRIAVIMAPSSICSLKKGASTHPATCRFIIFPTHVLSMGCGNGKDRVLDALSGDRPDDAPVAVFTQSSTLSQMDAVDAPWPIAHSDPERMARLGSAQADMFGFDSVRVPFCVTVEAEALGCEVDLGTRTSSPKVLPGSFTMDPFGNGSSDPSDIPSPSEFMVSERIGVVSGAVSSLSKSHGDEVPVITGVTCPLTMLSQMVGAENMVVTTITDPGIIGRWSKEITRRLIPYIRLLEDSGADVILLGEASASPDLIDPGMFDTLAGDHLRMLSSEGDSSKVLHICGHVEPILERMSGLGYDALSLEGAVDPYLARRTVKDEVRLVGNVGPVDPLMVGTPADVIKACGKSRDAGFDVISPGCGIPIQTPDANILAMTSHHRG